jgi:ArsR family transcriptional regulator, virulence genes transcriptional regulator
LSENNSELDQGAVQAANILRALANPHRLMILGLLEKAPHNVMDLCERLNLRQSLASQHLARLRLDGIVAAERRGHHVIYSLRDGKAREILTVLSFVSQPNKIEGPGARLGPNRQRSR